MSSNIEPTDIEPPKLKKRSYYPTVVISITLVAIVVGASVWGLLSLAPRTQNKTHTPMPKIMASSTQIPEGVISTAKATRTPAPTATPTAAPQVSPTVLSTGPVGSPALLYGTNLSLNDSSDQVLTSAATRALLQQMHVGIVRIPMRQSLPEAVIVQAAQAVKSIGAAPMIILLTQDANHPSALTSDSKVVTDMQALFGSATVYYEYGNEPDLITGNPAPYIASWNQVVPQLKKLAPNARFVGPSMYTYDFNYLKNFLLAAKPLPDFVSWHEYTCDTSWAASVCMSHINNWTTHAANARSIMTAAIGVSLPIMITEWNYTANHSVAGDGKNDNAAFMTSWTTKALQTLAANGIYAAMQYACTNSQVPLITTGNALTPQGKVFQMQNH